MSKKDDLRKQRDGTVINKISKQQEKKFGKVLNQLEVKLRSEFGLKLHHEKKWMLKDIVAHLGKIFPDIQFFNHFPTSYMSPDGGIYTIEDEDGKRYPILISEVKNQGTNDVRAEEGKEKQSKGNAIERLGKNVIGFRTALLGESIFPFVCFGYGCDFEEGSSILDRVVTIAMFGPLNTISVVNQGEGGLFNRGSFFFRSEKWSEPEMLTVLHEVAKRSIHYYFAKYGDDFFKKV
jgi:type II restriction enzyme